MKHHATSLHEGIFASFAADQTWMCCSCKTGVDSVELGLLGRAFTGSLQVVQNLSIVPKSQHPRNKLKGKPYALPGCSLLGCSGNVCKSHAADVIQRHILRMLAMPPLLNINDLP